MTVGGLFAAGGMTAGAAGLATVVDSSMKSPLVLRTATAPMDVDPSDSEDMQLTSVGTSVVQTGDPATNLSVGTGGEEPASGAAGSGGWGPRREVALVQVALWSPHPRGGRLQEECAGHPAGVTLVRGLARPSIWRRRRLGPRIGRRGMR